MAEFVLTVSQDTALELSLNNGGSTPIDPVPLADIGGTVVESLAAEVVFNMVNGLQAFVLAVPGVLVGDRAWASLNGAAFGVGPELAAVGGCYVSNPDEVTVLVTYPGATSSVTVPLMIFWFTPPV